MKHFVFFTPGYLDVASMRSLIGTIELSGTGPRLAPRS